MSRTNNLGGSGGADALFKQFYGEAGTSLVNAKTPLASILMKNKRVDFVGSNFVQPVRFGSAVGLGYRAEGSNLPVPGASPRQQAVFPAKGAYAVAEYSRQAIVASRNDKGAFARVTVDEAESTMEGFMLHNVERALFGDASGKLGEIDGAVTGAGTSVSPWSFALQTNGTNAPKGKAKYFPQGARMDIYSQAGVYGMTIQIVSASTNSSTNVVTLTATTIATGATVAPVDDDLLYWEGNKDQEIVGLASIAPGSAGTLYGINQTSQPKFKGAVKTISGALAYDDVNDAISQLEEEKEAPDLAICSHKAMALLKNLSEDHKRYEVAQAMASDGKIGFKGMQLMSGEGPLPLVASQMCPDDEIFFLNKKYLQLVLRQDFGWFDDDGTILLRDPNKDVYSARYGGYFELFCSVPNSILRLKGFSV